MEKFKQKSEDRLPCCRNEFVLFLNMRQSGLLFLQLANPDAVEGLVLVNIDTDARGWLDWAAQKVCLLIFGVFDMFFFFLMMFSDLSLVQLSSVTSSLTEQILCHLFSQVRLLSFIYFCRMQSHHLHPETSQQN